MYNDKDLVDIYDEAMNHIGVESKGSVHQTGSWHKSIHCWITKKDSTGDYLLFQKRSADKKLLPDYYDVTVAGHLEKNEIVQDAIREVTEELGLETEFDNWRYLGIKFDVNKNSQTVNKEFCETFIIRNDQPLQNYHINREEVDSLIQIKIEDGLRLFAGETPIISAAGVVWDKNLLEWINTHVNVSVDMFIPRIDFYYSKMLINARLFLNGEKYIYV